MPMYDRICSSCGYLKEDSLEPVGRLDPQLCPDCNTLTLIRSIATGRFHKSTAITPDLIPGGVEIKHGICWPDGTPRRYDSKSEMRRVARDFGLENTVRHVPMPGTDKSKHTVRWVSAPVISEEERIAAWHAWERENNMTPPKELPRDAGLGIVLDGDTAINEIIKDSILKVESSGFNEAQYRGVNNPWRRDNG